MTGAGEAALNAALLAAHARGDRAAIIAAYRAAADRARDAEDVDTECFFLTHAYIWALEAGHPETRALHARLKTHGREE